MLFRSGIGTDNPVAKLEIDMDLTSHNNLSFRNLDISGVFRNTDETWLQEKKLLASDAAYYDSFGQSVAISGYYAIVGAYGDYYATGSAYIFEINSDGTWNQNQTQKLTASDADGNDFFGYSVSINGNYVIVGAPFNDDNGGSSGSAYIFERGADGTCKKNKNYSLVMLQLMIGLDGL